MSKRVIAFDLSPSGIDYALREIERFRKDFIKACNDLIKQLTTLGIDTAQSVLTFTTDGWTGFLENSLYAESGWDAQTRTGRVRTSAPYAAYVEFGTGIVGSMNSHPDAGAVNWEYDVHHHDFEGWTYYNMNDGKWHMTAGQPAKPFMYTAMARIKSNAGQYTATIFARL